MAAPLLLRQGRAGALKMLLLEAHACRGLAATAPLSAESGKADKGPAPAPKKQSAPKNVVAREAKARFPAAQATAALPQTVSAAGPRRPAGREGGVEAGPGPRPDGPLPKAVGAAPPKAPPPSEKQDSGPRAPRRDRAASASSSSSSSSSSLSSASDSDSEEEGHGSEAAPRGAGRGEGRLPPPGPPRREVSAGETPHADLAAAGKPRQAKKGGAGARDAGTARPGAEPGERGAPGARRAGRAGPQAPEAELGAGRARAGLATASGSPADRAAAGRRAAGGPGGAQALAPGTGLALPSRESEGRPGSPAGARPAEGEARRDPAPGETAKAAPRPSRHVPGDQTAAEAQGETAAGGRHAQEPAPAPPEPFDNSSYRNLQHHDYTPYTFLDLNRDLAAFRLPQPSAGRASPRH